MTYQVDPGEKPNGCEHGVRDGCQLVLIPAQYFPKPAACDPMAHSLWPYCPMALWPHSSTWTNDLGSCGLQPMALRPYGLLVWTAAYGLQPMAYSRWHSC